MADKTDINPYGRGRPKGAANYSGISLLAKTMKRNGLIWLDELVDAYRAYRDERNLISPDRKALGETPDKTLIQFWMAALPFLSLTLNEKSARGYKPQAYKRKVITKSSLDALARAEHDSR